MRSCPKLSGRGDADKLSVACELAKLESSRLSSRYVYPRESHMRSGMYMRRDQSYKCEEIQERILLINASVETAKGRSYSSKQMWFSWLKEL
jgi:hypothetical protein